jgi:hypothetical protein
MGFHGAVELDPRKARIRDTILEISVAAIAMLKVCPRPPNTLFQSVILGGKRSTNMNCQKFSIFRRKLTGSYLV